MGEEDDNCPVVNYSEWYTYREVSSLSTCSKFRIILVYNLLSDRDSPNNSFKCVTIIYYIVFQMLII